MRGTGKIKKGIKIAVGVLGSLAAAAAAAAAAKSYSNRSNSSRAPSSSNVIRSEPPSYDSLNPTPPPLPDWARTGGDYPPPLPDWARTGGNYPPPLPGWARKGKGKRKY